MKCKTIDLEFHTAENNMAEWDPRLKQVVPIQSPFAAMDLTTMLQEKTLEAGVTHGQMTLQVLHTTCILSVNELNEPMLLGDVALRMESLFPSNEKYLHDSDLREINRTEKLKPDQNGAAHLKSFLVGSPAVTLLIREGELMLGSWQRVFLIDFDGPKLRKLAVQFLGI